MNYKHTILYMLAVLGGALISLSCGEKPIEEGSGIDVQLEIPASITVDEADMKCSFRVKFEKYPLATDKIAFENTQGKKSEFPLTISGKRVDVVLSQSIVSGSYKIYVTRGSASLLMGETSLLVKSVDMELSPSTTVYGVVTSDGAPLKGVVVSDGVEVVTTDDKGLYQLASKKNHKYVFVSVPSGYEAKAEGVFPTFSKQLKSAANAVENVNFELSKTDGQDNHIMVFMGDMHLANRNNDLTQFNAFLGEMNKFVADNAGKKVYGITLGDMTWDLYWVSRKFNLTHYVSTINTIKGMQIFHCVGNHDHEMEAAGDFDTVLKYKQYIAPTYYSFNIGKVHYIVIDDIDCTNDGSGSRTYVERVVNEQVEWLKKDLQHVSKDTPVVIAMHAPFEGIKNKAEVLGIVSSYSDVHFVTGHTHKVTNYNKSGYREHVSGAVCADWWWSGKHNPTLLMSTDGAPGGYAVWTVTGKDFKWRYKATGRPDDYQFRSYDLNNVEFTDANLSKDIEADSRKAYISAYPKNSGNEVLINVWNWNAGWKITVVDEKGNTLKTSQQTAYDPLHIATRYQWSSSTTSNFGTQKNGDFFKVKASDADVDLTITVEDEFGNIYKETMKRPKAFNLETYK